MARENMASPPHQVDDGGGATIAVGPVTRPAPTDRKPKQLPPFKVLLHNDDVNTFEHVIVSIMRLTRLNGEEAILRALEAHESGLALLLVTHRERAELYQEQFTSVGIVVTIEPE